MCTLSGLHGLAAGLQPQSHHEGPGRPTEGLPGAGEQAAGGQPAAGGSDSQLGRQRHLTLSGLVQAGTDCQSAACTGQTFEIEPII